MTDLFRNIFLRFFVSLFSLAFGLTCFIDYAASQNITFHSDNPLDYESYKVGTPGGISSATSLEVLSRLDYQYDFAYMTTNRSMQFMAKGENICVLSRIKTKARAEKFIFSKSVNIYLTKQLFQAKRHPPLPKDLLDDFGAVYLPDLFKRFPNRTVVVSTQIAQGVGLDKQLDLIPTNNKVVRNGSAHEDGVIKMFGKNRADYILLFPQSLIEGQGVAQGVRNYPIAKAPMFQSGHFMCADNPYMREVVAAIDSILVLLKDNNQLYETHIKWLREEDKLHFTRLYHQAIGVD